MRFVTNQGWLACRLVERLVSPFEIKHQNYSGGGDKPIPISASISVEFRWLPKYKNGRISAGSSAILS